MELRDIEYFTVIADQKHLGRSADILGLSQPAISKSLRRLEDALQVKLFRRSHRGLELTAEGSVLLARTRELQLSLKSVAREVKEVSQGRVAHLRIGAGPSVRSELVAAACARLSMDMPRATIEVIVSDTDEITPALRKGDLDLILNLMYPTAPEGLRYVPLYDEEFVLCAAARHRLARKQKVTLADLSNERWASSGAALPTLQGLRAIFEGKGLPPPHVAFESRSSWLRLQVAASSDLLLYASRSLIRLGQASGYPLAILPVRELVWLRPIGAILRREDYVPAAVQRLIDHVRAALAVNGGGRRSDKR
jgi:DNA-binding transcriptional LysR family regulator